MAITKITAPSSIPATVADYQAQNSHLMAFINQINSQAFILSDPNGTVAPTIKQGAYISHGGSLYIVDTADATISGTPSDGTVYVRVSGTDTLTAEYITDISSYAWNSAYNAMISGSYTLLPYMLIKSGTSWTKYRFEQHKQATGNAIIDGHDIDSELDTLNGRVNQGVKTTDSPTFASVNTGHGANELYPMNQAVRTTDNVSFANINPPVDNNDASMPSVGIGGFSYAVASTSTVGNYPSITIGSGGTWVYITNSTRSDDSSISPTRTGRVAGGSSVQGRIAANSENTTYVYVIAWRIA